MIGLIIGLVVGATIGILISAIVQASVRAEAEERLIFAVKQAEYWKNKYFDYFRER